MVVVCFGYFGLIVLRGLLLLGSLCGGVEFCLSLSVGILLWWKVCLGIVWWLFYFGWVLIVFDCLSGLNNVLRLLV